MITWIVMYINQLMFGPLSDVSRNFLQFIGFVELFAEVAFLVIVIGVFIYGRLEK